MTDDNWTKTTAYLALTRPGVSQLLDGSSVRSLAAGVLTVHVSREGALYHLGRIGREVDAAASSIWGERLRVEFVNGAAPQVGISEVEPEPLPAPVGPSPAVLEFDFSLDQWVKHPRYLSLFYQPYLASFGRFTSRAFGVWQFLRDSFDLKNRKEAWTPVYRSTLHDLAKANGCTPHQLAGVWSFCPLFERTLAETGEPLAVCCMRYNQAGRRDWPAPATEAHPEGRPVCRYWKAGIFQLLAEHGLVVVEQAGTSSRTTVYRLQAARWPLLLTPAQVSRLDSSIWQAHEDFLANDLRLSVEAWRAVELVALAEVRADVSGLELDNATLSLNRLNRSFFCSQIEFKQTQSPTFEAKQTPTSAK